MSPDWSAKEEPVPYAKLDDPQSLNLYSYVENNPLSRVDADGHCCDLDEAAQFVGGALNAFVSDNALGAGRVDQTSSAGRLGAAFGDAGAAVQGLGEFTLGAGGNVAGFALDATGVGALIGVPANVASTAVMLHGTATGVEGITHLAMAATKGDGSQTKPSSTGKMQKEVENGQAPKQVDRVDKGRGPHEQDHVHFNDKSARNQDGTWKHDTNGTGSSNLTSKVMKWLTKHGWN